MHQIENEAIPGQPRTAIPRKCLPTAKSRGPATTEGQRRSSMNALKHPLSRQIGQTLRNQRWLVRELPEYRKQKLDPDQGGGEGDNTSERTTSIGRRETEQQPHTSELHPRHRARSLRERLPAADARKQRPRRAGKAPQSTQ